MEGFKVFEWLVAAFTTLMGWVWIAHNKRFEKLEEKLDDAYKELHERMPTDFERDELTRQRVKTEDSILRIEHTLEEMRERATKRHLELLAKIEVKADRNER